MTGFTMNGTWYKAEKHRTEFKITAIAIETIIVNGKGRTPANFPLAQIKTKILKI